MIANWRQQVMSKHVHDIALQAPADQLEQYLSAADEFRIPYWDWAQGTIIGPVPEFFITPTLTLTNIDGVSMPISNPLYSYRFRPIPDGFDDKVSLVSTTCKKNKKMKHCWPLMISVVAEYQRNDTVAQLGRCHSPIAERTVLLCFCRPICQHSSPTGGCLPI